MILTKETIKYQSGKSYFNQVLEFLTPWVPVIILKRTDGFLICKSLNLERIEAIKTSEVR